MKKSKNKISLENAFFKIVCIVCSFIKQSFISLFYFLEKKGDVETIKNTLAFKNIDFFIKSWPKYFSKKPSAFKIFSLIGDFIHHSFLKK